VAGDEEDEAAFEQGRGWVSILGSRWSVPWTQTELMAAGAEDSVGRLHPLGFSSEEDAAAAGFGAADLEPEHVPHGRRADDSAENGASAGAGAQTSRFAGGGIDTEQVDGRKAPGLAPLHIADANGTTPRGARTTAPGLTMTTPTPATTPTLSGGKGTGKGTGRRRSVRGRRPSLLLSPRGMMAPSRTPGNTPGNRTSRRRGMPLSSLSKRLLSPDGKRRTPGGNEVAAAGRTFDLDRASTEADTQAAVSKVSNRTQGLAGSAERAARP